MGNLDTPLTATPVGSTPRAVDPEPSPSRSSSSCTVAPVVPTTCATPGSSAQPGQQPHQRHGAERAGATPGTRSTRRRAAHRRRRPDHERGRQGRQGRGARLLGLQLGPEPQQHPGRPRWCSRPRSEADIVVVQMQGGAEGSDKSHVRPAPRSSSARTGATSSSSATRWSTPAPTGLRARPARHARHGVLQGPAHRLQPRQLLRVRRWARPASIGVGGVLKVSLHKDGTWARGELVPTEMVNGGYPAPTPTSGAGLRRPVPRRTSATAAPHLHERRGRSPRPRAGPGPLRCESVRAPCRRSAVGR